MDLSSSGIKAVEPVHVSILRDMTCQSDSTSDISLTLPHHHSHRHRPRPHKVALHMGLLVWSVLPWTLWLSSLYNTSHSEIVIFVALCKMNTVRLQCHIFEDYSVFVAALPQRTMTAADYLCMSVSVAHVEMMRLCHLVFGLLTASSTNCAPFGAAVGGTNLCGTNVGGLDIIVGGTTTWTVFSGFFFSSLFKYSICHMSL